MTLITVTAFILGMSHPIQYPAICKESYLSNEEPQNVDKVIKTLSSKPGCMQIGEEVITEGESAGKIFPIYTCCTSVEEETK